MSLTERLVIHPILSLRAPPLESTFWSGVRHMVESEVVSRVVALATSLFAGIDAGIHLGAFLFKGVHWALRRWVGEGLSPSPSPEQVLHHGKQAAWWLGVASVGSVAAAVWPGVLRYFAEGAPRLGPSRARDWREASERVQALWDRTADRKAFEQLWMGSSLNDRETYVRLLDADVSPKGTEARRGLVHLLYRKVRGSSESWPQQHDQSVFCHATSLEGLEGILKGEKIEVRHEKLYRGAFVSTKPETDFGKYVLVFNRSIERLSHLTHGFSVGDAYWAGFSRDIPVNQETLNCILLHEGSFREANRLERQCAAWGGRPVEVKTFSDRGLMEGYQDIPHEWPGGDPHAHAIQKTMAIRARQPLALKQTSQIPAIRQVVDAIWKSLKAIGLKMQVPAAPRAQLMGTSLMCLPHQVHRVHLVHGP